MVIRDWEVAISFRDGERPDFGIFNLSKSIMSSLCFALKFFSFCGVASSSFDPSLLDYRNFFIDAVSEGILPRTSLVAGDCVIVM